MPLKSVMPYTITYNVWRAIQQTVSNFLKITLQKTKITVSSMLYFKAKNLSFHMPQTICQYHYNFVCNHKIHDDGLGHFWTYNEI